ncbi:glucosaminidase domain-containing protein [Burkholderia gladioli]|nr:glucosaminidase domain-containing protein [Burkholderia gladioli]
MRVPSLVEPHLAESFSGHRPGPAQPDPWHGLNAAEVIEAAQTARAKWCVLAPIPLFAQWALESGFWHHLPSGSNNPFGVKRTSRIEHFDQLAHRAPRVALSRTAEPPFGKRASAMFAVKEPTPIGLPHVEQFIAPGAAP